MLVDGRAFARDARNDDPGLFVRRDGLGFEERRRLVEHGPVAAFAHIAGENVGQPEMRIARLGPLAEPRAAARRAMPPFEHVAFAELLARVQHDLRPGQPRLEEGQRQHVLQLVAIAGRAAKLVRADAAEQPRGVELIGQPGIDQPVEVRPVGADLDLAEPLGPGGARRGEFALGADDADARRGGERFRAGRRLAEGDRDLCLAARRQNDLAAKGRDAPPVVARGAVARAGLDHRGRQDVAARARRRSGRGWSRSPAARSSSRRRRSRARSRCCGFWNRSVEPTVSSRILSTLALGLSSSARSKNGAMRRRFGFVPRLRRVRRRMSPG